MSSTAVGGPRIKLNSGYEIPLVGFGTYKVVGQDAIDKCVDAALACGYRHFDTAKLYVNEPELGNALEKFLPKYGLKREDIFITTKFMPPKDEKELNLYICLSYLDLVLIHYPKSPERAEEDPQNVVARKECWLALEKIPESKVHSIGISNYEVNHIEEMSQYSQKVPAVNQVEYHPHFRRQQLKEYCSKRGIFFQAFSSLGRHHPDLIGDPVVVELVQKYNTTPQIVLLSFATSQNVGVVPKSENPDRIRDNLKCLELHLTSEEIQELNSIDKDQHYIRCTGWLVK
ncbi:aldo/keto reductase family domain-containing protein [Ditylenchus destructor]|uniref:Aldo/keto reductase family domain-containing protein n=1 Tax=Ditylenchus destructor TaxID=166010 RepID=A0AAD4N436_9BILA|nr:aldo/keto reductase family domain-containing protein [Ditylenchus destructor]